MNNINSIFSNLIFVSVLSSPTAVVASEFNAETANLFHFDCVITAPGGGTSPQGHYASDRDGVFNVLGSDHPEFSFHRYRLEARAARQGASVKGSMSLYYKDGYLSETLVGTESQSSASVAELHFRIAVGNYYIASCTVGPTK